jgi:hypothetical protein
MPKIYLAIWYFDSGFYHERFNTKKEAESMIRRVENMGAFDTKIEVKNA